MDWPHIPIEQIPPDEFRPPFCPWPLCRTHGTVLAPPFRCHKHGSYSRLTDERVVPRYLCLICGCTCSLQSFAGSYYLKRPELLEPVAAGLVAGSANRQLARSLGCAPSTVTRLSARLGRHALLFHVRGLRDLPEINEPVVYDDLETFAVRQDAAVGLGTPVGQRTGLIYGLEHARHRRHTKRRARGKEASRTPAAHRRAFERTVDRLLDKRPRDGRLTLITDKHPGYRSGMRNHPQRRFVEHRIHPNPKRRRKGAPRSPRTRLRDREMFPVDALHALMRHTQAHHRRETIAFGRRINALLERGWLFIVWRNWIKARSERKPDPTTPAMAAGLSDEPWSWSRLLGRRLCAWRLDVPDAWMRVYKREIVSPEIGRNRRHELVHAF